MYGQCILKIEHGVFSPLILSISGGMGRETHTFYKCLADLLSLKHDMPYSSLVGWLRCKLSFAILRSAVMCIRGSRSSMHHATRDFSDIAVACSEGCVPWNSNCISLRTFNKSIISKTFHTAGKLLFSYFYLCYLFNCCFLLFILFSPLLLCT